MLIRFAPINMGKVDVSSFTETGVNHFVHEVEFKVCQKVWVMEILVDDSTYQQQFWWAQEDQ